jgi:tRNA nucleotidyltransferase (CCA-adding enzyme)
MAGLPYIGKARLFGRDYMARYTALENSQGQVIGATFVGVDITQDMVNLRARLAKVKVGDSGHVHVLALAGPERVWKELEKVLTNRNPQIFFEILHDCEALSVLLPEVEALFGVPARPDWHPEVDTGIHVMMALREASQRSDLLAVRFATLCHDLGKAQTPAHVLPSHHGHGDRGLPLIRSLCQRLRVPNDCRDLALLVSELHSLVHTALQLRPATMLKLFDRLDVWRKPERLSQLLLCCQADFHGRLGFAEREYLQPTYVQEAYEAAAAIAVRPIVEAGYTGEAIRQQLSRRRIFAIRDVHCRWNDI